MQQNRKSEAPSSMKLSVQQDQVGSTKELTVVPKQQLTPTKQVVNDKVIATVHSNEKLGEPVKHGVKEQLVAPIAEKQAATTTAPVMTPHPAIATPNNQITAVEGQHEKTMTTAATKEQTVKNEPTAPVTPKKQLEVIGTAVDHEKKTTTPATPSKQEHEAIFPVNPNNQLEVSTDAVEAGDKAVQKEKLNVN